MDPVIFDTWLHHLATDANWTSVDVRGALFDRSAGPWTPSKGDLFVATVTAAGAVEVGAASYARQALGTQTATTDGSGHRELLDAAVIDFGSLEAGSDYDTFVLFVHVTNDADSYLVAAIDFGSHTTDGTDVTVVPNADGIFELIQP